MTGGSRPRTVADGGPPHAGLFESFPDPLLAYGRVQRTDDSERPNDTDGGTDGNAGGLVVRGTNPAFESAFDEGVDEVVETPLDHVVLHGTIVSGSPSTDEFERSDDSETTRAATTTARSILDRARTESDVRFSPETDGEPRHFHVRDVTTGPGRGYLLFTDVTGGERQRRELARTVERLERVGSIVRHDIRNPLEVAKIRLEAAQETGEDVHFEKVVAALDRIERIADDLFGAGDGRVDATEAVSLETVAEAAWEMVDTGDATLVTSGALPTVRGDDNRLLRLFENLFRNAVEHGGRDVTVTVEPLADGFAVSDDGPGVPSTDRERVFEAGYSTTAGNTGFGLFVVRLVAREHGWHVSLVSNEDPTGGADAGARFEFTDVDRVVGEDESSD